MRFGGHLLVVGDVGERVGPVQLDQQLPDEDDQLVWQLEDPRHLPRVGEEPIGRVPTVRVASVLKWKNKKLSYLQG